MTSASNEMTTRPTAEIIAFPAGGRRAFLMARDARAAMNDPLSALEREAAKVPMIRGCWYHDDAISEADVVGASH